VAGRDQASIFAGQGVSDGKGSITAITGSGEMRGGEAIPEVESIAEFETREHCLGVVGWEDGEPDSR